MQPATLVHETAPSIDGPEEWLRQACTSVPHVDITTDLAIRVRSVLRKDLHSALTQCEMTLSINCLQTLEALMELPVQTPWSPEIFLRTKALRAAMRTGQVTAILDEIQGVVRMVNGTLLRLSTAHVSSILHEQWEESYVRHLRQYDQKTIRGESTIVRPIIDCHKLEFHKSHIEAALDLMAAHDEKLFAEVRSLVTDIKLFEGRVLRGDTSVETYGAMWIRVPEPEDDQVGYWLEHITHEVSHLRLASLSFFDKLVLNPNSERKFKAPIRDDPRPMLGIFHASFVLARMVRLFRRLSLAGYDKRFRDRLQLCNLQFDRGLESLKHPDARFSEMGHLVKDSLLVCAERT